MKNEECLCYAHWKNILHFERSDHSSFFILNEATNLLLYQPGFCLSAGFCSITV